MAAFTRAKSWKQASVHRSISPSVHPTKHESAVTRKRILTHTTTRVNLADTGHRRMSTPPAHVPPSLFPGVTSQISHLALNVRVCFWGNQSHVDECLRACADRLRFIYKSQLHPEPGATYLNSRSLNFCSNKRVAGRAPLRGWDEGGSSSRGLPQPSALSPGPQAGSPRHGCQKGRGLPRPLCGLLPSLCAHSPPNLLFLPGHGQTGVGLTSANFLNLNQLLKYPVSAHNHVMRFRPQHVNLRGHNSAHHGDRVS